MYIDCGLIGDTRGGRVAATPAGPPSLLAPPPGTQLDRSRPSRTVLRVFMTVARFSNLTSAPGETLCSRSPPHCLLFPDQSLCVNSWPLQKLAIRRLRSQYLHRISFGQSDSCRAVSAPHNFYPTIYQFLSVRFVIPLSPLTNDSVKIVNFSVFPWRARFLLAGQERLQAGSLGSPAHWMPLCQL